LPRQGINTTNFGTASTVFIAHSDSVICDRPITERKHLGAVCLRQSLAASGDGSEVHTVEDSPATSRQVTQASETEHTGATCPQVIHCRQDSPARQEKMYRQETSGGNEGTATMEAYMMVMK
jgi:hypothetical protein